MRIPKGPLAVLACADFLLRGAAPAEEVKTVEVLFVQSAHSAAFDGNTLTLKDVSPSTLFFSDRPERIAGHYTNDEYLKVWTEGRDSFLKDPPNAVVSVFTQPGADPTDVVVTLRNPRISGRDLKYDIKWIRGRPPSEGGPTAVFIDIIGLPFTPLSFAGVARRTAYRSMAYGAAASGAAAAQSDAAASAAASAAAASQSAAAASEAAAAQSAAQRQTPAQRLQELESLYKQGLITQSDYEAGKAKILAEITQ